MLGGARNPVSPVPLFSDRRNCKWWLGSPAVLPVMWAPLFALSRSRTKSYEDIICTAVVNTNIYNPRPCGHSVRHSGRVGSSEFGVPCSEFELELDTHVRA